MACEDKERRAQMSSEKSKTTRRCEEEIPSFGSTSLKINVGQGSSKQSFFLHKDIAIKYSDFLAAASRNGWKEATDSEVNLPEEDPDLFKIFEAFIYSGRIYCRRADDETPTLMAGPTIASGVAWPKYASIDKLVNEDHTPDDTFASIYDGSEGPSPMKTLHVDLAIWEWNQDRLKYALEFASGNMFLADIAIKQSTLLREGKPMTPPYVQDSTCIYHEHGDSKPCYKDMFK